MSDRVPRVGRRRLEELGSSRTEAAADAGSSAPAGVAEREHEDGVEAPSAGSLPDTRHSARYGLARLVDHHGDLRSFEAIEEEVIRFAVVHSSGRMTEVARRLRIGRSTLYRKLREYGIEPRRAAP